jgi:hypothetical protein
VLEAFLRLPEELGSVEQMLADNGFFSKANVASCEQVFGIIKR